MPLSTFWNAELRVRCVQLAWGCVRGGGWAQALRGGGVASSSAAMTGHYTLNEVSSEPMPTLASGSLKCVSPPWPAVGVLRALWVVATMYIHMSFLVYCAFVDKHTALA